MPYAPCPMFNANQLLADKKDTILDLWLEAVRNDRQIESAINLSETALGDSMPELLDGIVQALANEAQESMANVLQASLNHGVHRAQEGYDAAEIAREYKILRNVIFEVLEADLYTASAPQIIRTLHLINSVIDEAISFCFKSYVEQRLNELDQLQRQLKLTNTELTRLVRASQDNLSYMAHELKTPLTSIIGYSDLYLRQHKQKTESQDTLPNLTSIERVLKAGRQLLHLINDALELSRYDAGKMEVRPVAIAPLSVINNVIETIEPLAGAKNLQLQIDCARAPDEVETDPFRLQQILTNLLSNAVRYTDRGFVRLECLSLPDLNWAIIVSDSGIGIDAEEQIRIFEPYAQAFARDPRRDSESTGLGLAIVARMVQLLGGEIQLESQLAVGSTFKVIFPQKIQ
jgi:signal transduction histidine kinase